MFTPIYLKTDNTLLSSLIQIDALIDFAKEHDIKALAISDNNLYGVMDFYNACIKNNIKPIIGLEINLQHKFIIYAKTNEGYQNLLMINKIQSERPLKGSELKKYNKDILCIIPYEMRNFKDKMMEIYEDLYVGVSLPSEEGLYVQETVFLKPSDREFMPYLDAIKAGTSIDKIEIKQNDNRYLYLPNQLSTTHLEFVAEIIEKCNVTIEPRQDLMIKYPTEEPIKLIQKLCREGLIRHFGNNVPEAYITRLKHELKIINNMNFVSYFLVVWDFIKYAKDNDIYIGAGRGSAVGSLVAYLLDITTIDPLKYNLLFERFLNPERVSMPDIDVDIEASKRNEVVKYCIQKYGQNRVLPIITFSHLKIKQAVRDVGRAMDINVEFISKNIDDKTKSMVQLSKSETKKDAKIVEYLNTDPDLLKLCDVVDKIMNIKKSKSVHAAGVILSEYPIDQIIPVEYSKEMPTTGIDMTYLEANGLLKMDFLSVNNLGIIHNIIKDINTNLTIDNIPENDPKTLSIFNQGDLIGIFQFDGAGMISFMKKFKPRKLTDVHAAMALYRPGPMENIPSYIARHEGKEEITYLDKRLEPILKDTYGIIVYQEQVMQIAVSLAGFTMGRADSLRKAMSKKKAKEMQTLKEEFLNGCINNGMTEEKAETIFAYIQKFASYGFNKSHSVGYSKIAYQMAYLKAHYRPYFMKNFLNSSIGSSDSIKTYVTETRDNGVEVYAPDINISTHEFELKNNALVFPLTGLKDVGTSSVHQIVEERLNGPFTDIYDFLKRCYSKSVNKKVIESLILGGCFDNLGITRQTLYNNLPELLLYGEVKDCLDLDLKPVLIEEEEFSHNMLLEFEKEIYGFYLLHHPVTDYKNEKSIDIKDLKNHIDAQVNLILLVDRFREITTKKGDKMAFVTGSDESGNLELAIFPKTYEKHNDLHLQGVYNFKCKVECTDGVIKGIIRDFKYLS